MTDDELIAVLVDTEAGLSPAEGYGPTTQKVRALIAERNRLLEGRDNPFDDLNSQYGCPDCGVHANCARVVEEREQWKMVARLFESVRDRMRDERDKALEMLERLSVFGDSGLNLDLGDASGVTVEQAFAAVVGATRRNDWELHEDQSPNSVFVPKERTVVSDEELLAQRWFAVPDVMIGGWCVVNVDRPDNDLDVDAGERQIGDFLSRAVAEHIVELHNPWVSADRLGSAPVETRGPRVPKYVQIVDWLKDQIATGVAEPGDLVPSERDISEFWNCARPTATKALDILRREGVIYSEQGRGTFVAAPRGEQEGLV